MEGRESFLSEPARDSNWTALVSVARRLQALRRELDISLPDLAIGAPYIVRADGEANAAALEQELERVCERIPLDTERVRRLVQLAHLAHDVYHPERIDRPPRNALKLAREDVVAADSSSQQHRPAYILAISSGVTGYEGTPCLIVSIRGTKAASDALTDLDFDLEEVDGGGKAHRGFLASARALYSEIVPLIAKYRKEKGVQKLILVGHSLGGSVATVLLVLLKRFATELAELNAEAVCFGAAPSLDDTLAQEIQEHAQTMVFFDDIMPRSDAARFVDLMSDIAVHPWQSRLRTSVMADSRVKALLRARDAVRARFDELRAKHTKSESQTSEEPVEEHPTVKSARDLFSSASSWVSQVKRAISDQTSSQDTLLASPVGDAANKPPEDAVVIMAPPPPLFVVHPVFVFQNNLWLTNAEQGTQEKIWRIPLTTSGLESHRAYNYVRAFEICLLHAGSPADGGLDVD